MSERVAGSRALGRRLGTVILVALSVAACRSAASSSTSGTSSVNAKGTITHETAFLDSLQERTFRYFWDLADPQTRLTPDRWPTPSFASISATGFGLTAYPIGVEHGWISREAACRRVLDTLRFAWTAPQDSTPSATGYHGFFYHFLDPKTGRRFQDVELSTMDTALFLAGVLFCQSYFDRAVAEEDSVRALADSLYARADWQWCSPRPPAVGHGWSPEEKFLPWDWGGYNEAMILYILALGSPTHPAPPEAWSAWTQGYQWGSFYDQEHVGFAPIFGHQYTQVWIDLRRIQDDVMRRHGIDYFENSRRAVLAQHAYAIENPGRWSGYGPRLWGMSACDGPVDGTFDVQGVRREFHSYWARGASFNRVSDDGTLSPSAVAGSIVFAPEIVVPTLVSMRDAYGERIWSTYGFLDAMNPTCKPPVPVQFGEADSTLGWFDTDYLGIDQGPILAMIENARTGLVWRTMRRNPHVVRGLRRAGFTGGWLDEAAGKR
jgi:hypothetical protein